MHYSDCSRIAKTVMATIDPESGLCKISPLHTVQQRDSSFTGRGFCYLFLRIYTKLRAIDINAQNTFLMWRRISGTKFLVFTMWLHQHFVYTKYYVKNYHVAVQIDIFCRQLTVCKITVGNQAYFHLTSSSLRANDLGFSVVSFQRAGIY